MRISPDRQRSNHAPVAFLRPVFAAWCLTFAQCVHGVEGLSASIEVREGIFMGLDPWHANELMNVSLPQLLVVQMLVARLACVLWVIFSL